MRSVLKIIASVAGTNATVLLLGESGVGKEVVAHALHDVPPRASHPFLKVNCAALPGDLLESELFGHDKGAFTGAYREKPGKFELARHGTIMLDEIGEIPLDLQAKLLQVLQDGALARVGGNTMFHSDARVVAATNRNLQAAIRARQFREDLFYRLNVISIRVPPLRERREEIPVLADHFLRRFNAAYGRAIAVSPAMMRTFTDHSWPGNIRELENAIKRMVVWVRPCAPIRCRPRSPARGRRRRHPAPRPPCPPWPPSRQASRPSRGRRPALRSGSPSRRPSPALAGIAARRPSCFRSATRRCATRLPTPLWPVAAQRTQG